MEVSALELCPSVWETPGLKHSGLVVKFLKTKTTKTKQKVKTMIFPIFIFYEEVNELDCATFGYLLLKPLTLQERAHRLSNGLRMPPGGLIE